jgi:hypothetical protein
VGVGEEAVLPGFGGVVQHERLVRAGGILPAAAAWPHPEGGGAWNRAALSPPLPQRGGGGRLRRAQVPPAPLAPPTSRRGGSLFSPDECMVIGLLWISLQKQRGNWNATTVLGVRD